MPKKKPKPITARNACDRIFSQIIRDRDRVCISCATAENLQCAHVISRRYAHTRTYEDNAMALCAGCHMHFHANPDEWIDFIDATIGRRMYDQLKTRALLGVRVKFDWFSERERLKAIHAEVFA